MRRSRLSWSSTRRATASVIERFMPHRLPRPGPGTPTRRRVVPVRSSSAAGVSSAISPPSRISSSRSHRSASSITWLDTISAAPAAGELVERVPQLAAQHRVEPDGRLVEHQHLRACVSSATASDTRDRCPPDSCPASESESSPRPTVSARALRSRRRPTPSTEAKNSQVLPDRQVGVDARRLGDVADPAPQRGAAGRLAEHRDRAALDDLHADDAAHQRRLAASRRSEQPGDLAVCRLASTGRG